MTATATTMTRPVLAPVRCAWRWQRFPVYGRPGVLQLTTTISSRKRPVVTEYTVELLGYATGGYHVRMSRVGRPERYDLLLDGEHSQCDCASFTMGRAHAETWTARSCKHIHAVGSSLKGLADGITEGTVGEVP